MNRMGDQTVSHYREKKTPKQFPGPASHKRKHSPENKTPLQMFQNRYHEYVSQIDKSIPVYLFDNLQDSRPRNKSVIPVERIKDCTAIKLSTILTEILAKESARDNFSEDEAMHRCIKYAEETGVLNQVEDIEMLIIYLQQMRTIINADSATVTCPNTSRSYSRQHLSLFSAFWNKTKWEDIFLSMPEFAAKLQNKKELLIGIMLRKNGRFRLDSAANEFLRSTGLGNENDIYLISFLDFYFFAWLSHFGLINYLDGEDNDPVMIEVTGYGRKFLQILKQG